MTHNMHQACFCYLPVVAAHCMLSLTQRAFGFQIVLALHNAAGCGVSNCQRICWHCVPPQIASVCFSLFQSVSWTRSNFQVQSLLGACMLRSYSCLCWMCNWVVCGKWSCTSLLRIMTVGQRTCWYCGCFSQFVTVCSSLYLPDAWSFMYERPFFAY
jgi:hypothetical protein